MVQEYSFLPIILEVLVGAGCLQISNPEVAGLEIYHIQRATLLKGPCGGIVSMFGGSRDP